MFSLWLSFLFQWIQGEILKDFLFKISITVKYDISNEELVYLQKIIHHQCPYSTSCNLWIVIQQQYSNSKKWDFLDLWPHSYTRQDCYKSVINYTRDPRPLKKQTNKQTDNKRVAHIISRNLCFQTTELHPRGPLIACFSNSDKWTSDPHFRVFRCFAPFDWLRGTILQSSSVSNTAAYL